MGTSHTIITHLRRTYNIIRNNIIINPSLQEARHGRSSRPDERLVHNILYSTLYILLLYTSRAVHKNIIPSYPTYTRHDNAVEERARDARIIKK